jgi:hypothetical protein
MAKAAKSGNIEVTPRLVNGVIKDVMEAFDMIESARGTYMNAARRQRDKMASVYERAAQQGIPQKVMKLQIKIEQTQAKLTGLITELEEENRAMLEKVVRAHGVPTQLALFPDIAPAGVRPRAKRGARKAKAQVTEDTMGEPVGAA